MPAATTRWGLLGAGQISRTQSLVLPAAEGAELFAVAARDVERARALGAPRAYGSYAELIADPDVDAVYVGLSNDAHLPWVVEALRAEKPVLCEKPLALTLGEVDTMLAVADEVGGLLVEASWYRWHPRTRLAERMLRDGAIGEVTSVSAGFSFAGVPADNFRLDPAKGGGALYDIGCYALSGVLWAVGQGLPVEVTARTANSDTGVDLTADVLMTWGSGATAEVHVSMAEPEKQWLVARGEHGEIELAGQPYTASWTAPAELLVSDGRKTDRLEVAAADPYKLMFEQVSAVARGEDGWVLPLADSRLTAAVVDAALASARRASEPVRP
ncbi:MAG TPA: Gfo/Idh/MocA family oxidoreductase [Frankiaceae bacterium]|nr:Gfo/Idh/MocA family oxidoreductase [Frankiaceae bacterium]